MKDIFTLLKEKDSLDIKLLSLYEQYDKETSVSKEHGFQITRKGRTISKQIDITRKKTNDIADRIKNAGYKVSTNKGPIEPLQVVNACGRTPTPDGLSRTVIGHYTYDKKTESHCIYEEDTSSDIISYNKVPIEETTLLFVTPQTRRDDIPIMEGDILFDPEAYRCVTVVRYDKTQKNFFADNYEISLPDNYEITEVANLVFVNSVPLYEIDTTTSYLISNLAEVIPLPDIPYFPEHPFLLKEMVEKTEEILQSPNLNQPSQRL